MIAQPDIIHPSTVLIVSLTLGTLWGCVEIWRHETPHTEPDYGSVGESWWVDRAKRGGKVW